MFAATATSRGGLPGLTCIPCPLAADLNSVAARSWKGEPSEVATACVTPSSEAQSAAASTTWSSAGVGRAKFGEPEGLYRSGEFGYPAAGPVRSTAPAPGETWISPASLVMGTDARVGSESSSPMYAAADESWTAWRALAPTATGSQAAPFASSR